MGALGEARWEAIGTHVHVLSAEADAIDAAADAVRALIDHVDRTYSRFRSDSELTAVNALAGRRVTVSPLLYAALDAAIRAARATDGAVDPTVGHALRLLGYDRDFALMGGRSDAAPVVVARVPGWQTVELDPATSSVRTARTVLLDLGSTGKALAADLAAEAAHAATGAGVLVSLGGDIATAGEAPAEGWPVLCADDSRVDPASDGEVIAIHSGDALATSSTIVRRWTAGGVVRHHIVDPWSGQPAGGPWRTATVVAGTCVDANAAATAAIVLGERAEGWLEGIGLPALLRGDDGRTVRLAGWPDPADDAALPDPRRIPAGAAGVA